MTLYIYIFIHLGSNPLNPFLNELVFVVNGGVVEWDYGRRMQNECVMCENEIGSLYKKTTDFALYIPRHILVAFSYPERNPSCVFEG